MCVDLIKGFIQAGNLINAFELFQKLQSTISDLPPEVYEAVIQELAKHPSKLAAHHALIISERMHSKFVPFSLEMLKGLLQLLSSHLDDMALFFDFVQRISSLPSFKKNQNDPIIIEILLQASCRSENLSQSESYLQQLTQLQISPSIDSKNVCYFFSFFKNI